jgi:hypothetical protein
MSCTRDRGRRCGAADCLEQAAEQLGCLLDGIRGNGLEAVHQKAVAVVVVPFYFSYGFFGGAALASSALACRSTTCDESLTSVTIRNLCGALEGLGLLAASTFNGPIA